MSDMRLTGRQRRELEFYEEFSKSNEPLEVNFDVIAGEETRPWNSYWRVAEIAKQHFKSGDQRLLDFGCGTGMNSLVFAKIGKEASLDRHVTHDERKLSADDIEAIRRFDPNLSVERFLLLSRLDRFLRNPSSKAPSRLEKIDFRLFKLLPFLKAYSGIIVLVLKKQWDDNHLASNKSLNLSAR